jgi:hypothetical protein
VADRPILFSAPMVRALLAGTKTQTRRVLKAVPPPGAQRVIRPFRDERLQWAATDPHDMEQGQLVLGDAPRCPYGAPGDRLWVRETWAYHLHAQASSREADGPFVFAADGKPALHVRLCEHWRPSIHMPRTASRITLEVTGVRVERLQSISVRDAIAEGATPLPPDPVCAQVCPEDYVAGYRSLWESINGTGSWDANPWVWVVEFRRAG